MSLSSSLSVALRAVHSNTGDLYTASATVLKSFADTLADGTIVDTADRCFSDTRTLAASTPEDLDLAGTLVDALGNTVVFVEIVAIMVVAAEGNTNNVVVGNGTTPVIGGPFGAAGANTIAIQPGGCFLWWTAKNPGVAVAAGTADILKVLNGGAGTPVTYDIVIIGRSA